MVRKARYSGWQGARWYLVRMAGSRQPLEFLAFLGTLNITPGTRIPRSLRRYFGGRARV